MKWLPNGMEDMSGLEWYLLFSAVGLFYLALMGLKHLEKWWRKRREEE